VDEVQLVVEHAGGVRASFAVSRNQLHVDGAAGAGDVDRAHDLTVLEIPYADAAAQIESARHRVKSDGGTDEVAGHHQVELRVGGDAVRIEPFRRRRRRMLGHDLQLLVE